MGDLADAYTRRILVTGGAGFIGSHLVLRLVNRYPHYFIINLDKLDYCASLQHLDSINDKPNYKFIQGDIADPDFMRYIFEEQRIDTVFHLAAQSHVDLSFWSSLDFTHVNTYGTHVLVHAAYEARVRLFVYVSTDEVYGGGTQAFREDARLHPTNPYSASKASAECIVSSYWEAFKFPVIITRANNVYGTHQYPEKIIPKFISLLNRGEKCCIHGSGKTVRNFVHVTDICDAYDLILHKGAPGQIYNVGSEHSISVLDLATLIIKQVKKVETEAEVAKHVRFVQDRPFNDVQYPLDLSRMEALGWRQRVTWQEGLRETVRWYTETDIMQRWSNAESALAAFPTGSNTRRVFKTSS